MGDLDLACPNALAYPLTNNNAAADALPPGCDNGLLRAYIMAYDQTVEPIRIHSVGLKYSQAMWARSRVFNLEGVF